MKDQSNLPYKCSSFNLYCSLWSFITVWKSKDFKSILETWNSHMWKLSLIDQSQFRTYKKQLRNFIWICFNSKFSSCSLIKYDIQLFLLMIFMILEYLRCYYSDCFWHKLRLNGFEESIVHSKDQSLKGIHLVALSKGSIGKWIPEKFQPCQIPGQYAWHSTCKWDSKIR